MNILRTGKRGISAPILLGALATFVPLALFGQAETAVTQPTTATDDSGNDSVHTMEKYTVTGSYIPMASEELSIPVSVFGSQDMSLSGERTDTLNLLRKISPSIQGIGTENATIGTASTYGGALLTNHGLEVLVLIDGRRVASSAAEAVGGFRFVDLNMIPASAIDRIEVLQDGASAIYGSDAVGGVINLILKKNYNGWEVGTHYGYSTDSGHYSERLGYITGGVSNDKTSILISAEFSKHDPILFKDRPYTNPYYGTEYYPGIIDVFNAATGNDEDYKLNPNLNAPPGGGTATIDQLVASGVYTDLGSDADPATVAGIQQGFNLANNQTLISSLKRISFLINASHKIYGDKLQYFGEVQYTNTKTDTSLNAQPIFPYVSTPFTDLIEIGQTPPPAGTQFIPVTAAGNPFSQSWMEQGAQVDADGNPLDGNGVLAHNRFVAFPRLFHNDSTLFRTTDGFRGSINDKYSWEVAGTISRYTIDYANDNLIDANAFFTALEAGTINPFARTQDPSVLPGSILGSATMNGVSTLSSADFVFNGKPFELPAGSFSFAIGGQYSRETLSATADINTENKGWIDSPSILPINKARSVTAIYGEVEAPIIGGAQDIPGVYGLNADLAYRIERYSAIGASRVPKIALKYSPFNDELSFRFSAGKSFIAPTLYNLYGPVNVGSSQSVNYTPYGSDVLQQNVQFEGQTGSNPDLKPSTATNWTVGINFTPSQVKGLGITLDFFQSIQKGLPGSPVDETVVQSVEDLGAASPYVDDIHFGTVNGPTATAPGQVSAHPKSAVWIVTPITNLGGTLVRGIDGTIEYVIPTKQMGRFDLKTDFTLYNTFRLQVEPSEAYYSYVGTVTSLDAEATIPRWKTYTTLDWRWKGFDVAVNHLFIPAVQDIGPGGVGASAPLHVSSYSEFDLVIGYDFKALKWSSYTNGLSIQLGVNNVFNRYPPIAPNAMPDSEADVGFYGGAVGRELYVDASYTF